jgi:hypothetical protein
MYLKKYRPIFNNSISTLATSAATVNKDKLLIKISPKLTKNVKDTTNLLWLREIKIYLEPDFLEWLSGFTDAEGNFNITLRKLNDNTYTSVMLTFQIGLHIDDLSILEYIKENLNCGHISNSRGGSKCNYFINDNVSLIQVILPIFNHTKLNSSKYYQFLVFERAVNLIKEKKHLSLLGKLEMIKLYHEMKIPCLAPSSKELNNSPLTINWLGGFTDFCSQILLAKARVEIVPFL